MTPVNKLSTGQDSTLGNWLALCIAVLGEDSAAVAFLREKIATAPHGADEEVIADERQLLHALLRLEQRGYVPSSRPVPRSRTSRTATSCAASRSRFTRCTPRAPAPRA